MPESLDRFPDKATDKATDLTKDAAEAQRLRDRVAQAQMDLRHKEYIHQSAIDALGQLSARILQEISATIAAMKEARKT